MTNNNYKCPECNKSFSTKNTMEQHCKSTNHNRKIPCPHCNRSFSSQQARDQHIKSIHKKSLDVHIVIKNLKLKKPLTSIEHRCIIR